MTSTAPTVLITGTSTGIGFHTAIAAAKAGFTVVATMRDISRSGALGEAAAAAGVALDIRALDVTDAASVDAVVGAVVHDHGSIDAVVNNAGAASLGTVELLSMDQFRASMEVNFFGVVNLTRAAMPHLRESSGRVVTVTSVGGVIGQPFNESYCAAKFAAEGFLESLQPVAASVGVGVHIVEPGAVASEFVANAKIDPGQALATAGPYAAALAKYLERTAASFSVAQSAEDVADVIVQTLQGENVPFRVQTSAGATAFVGVKLGDLDGAKVTGMTAGWVGAV